MINLEKLKEEYKEIYRTLSHKEALKDRWKHIQLSRRFSFLEKVMHLIELRDRYDKEKEHLQKVIADEREEEEVKNLARGELLAVEKKIGKVEEEIEDKVFAEEETEKDIIIDKATAM